MIKLLKNELFIGILLGFFLGLSMISFFGKNEIQEQKTITEEVIIHKVDTVFIIRNPKTVTTLVSAEPEKYDSLRFYSGRKNFDYGFVDWKIETGGFLNEFMFHPTLLIPEKTHTETIIRTNYQKGIYLGGGFTSHMGYYVGASYLGKGWMADISYNPTLRQTQLGIKIRLGR
jgi:hypothetical protein